MNFSIDVLSMKKYQIIIGSNTEQEKHIAQVHLALQAVFGDIVYGSLMLTEPVGMTNPAVFYNQVAQITTSLSPQELNCLFKQMEVEIGRTPDDKKNGIVKIDIDLLASETQVYKPAEMERPYVRQGLAELERLETQSLEAAGNGLTEC